MSKLPMEIGADKYWGEVAGAGTGNAARIDSNFSELYNRPGVVVTDYGEIGVGNDSAVIQLAVDAAKLLIFRTDGDAAGTTFNQAYAIKIVFPPGEYILTTPIDMTGIRTSHSWWYVEARGAVFFLRTTGKTGFDFTYSRKCSWFGGTIIGEKDFLSRSGIQIGRNSGLQASDSHHFQDLEVKGYFSLAPIYNYACEDLLMTACHLKNSYDSPTAYLLVQDGDHYWGIESDFQTPAALNTAVSFLRNTFTRLDARFTGAGSGVWMSRTDMHSYHDSYVVTEEAAAFVLFANTAPSSNTGLTLDVHVETDFGDTDQATGNDYAILFDAASSGSSILLNELSYRDNYSHCSESFFAHTANVDDVNISYADVSLGEVGRDVGQTLFDTAADYEFHGRFASRAIGTNYDIDGIGNFSGTHFSLSTASHTNNTGGMFIVQDPNSMFVKNTTRTMVSSDNVADISFYSQAKALLGTFRYNATTSRFQFRIGTTTYLEMGTEWLSGLTDLVMSLGRVTNRFLAAYIKTVFIGDGATGITSGTGSPEGVLALPIGSIYTDDAGGTGTTLYVKETGAGGNTGWVAK